MSARIPCAFTGLSGLKPSFGHVPAWPLSPFGTVAMRFVELGARVEEADPGFGRIQSPAIAGKGSGDGGR